jgi:three-Cys-motif partner protein
MSRTTQEFGSAHTQKKLAAVQNYLSAFRTALKKQSFELIYIDACAGSGSSKPRFQPGQTPLLDVDDVTVGSAVRAMEIATPFDRYFFSDTKLKNVNSLATIVQEQFPGLAERVQIMRTDANEAVARVAVTTDWKRSRAVVFLDPFGLQMKFSMVEQLARTKAVDLWYLVPVLGMSRQVSKDGSIIEPGGTLVDELLGTREWRTNVLSEPQTKVDLFGPVTPPSQRVANAGWFEEIAIRQLSKIFAGGVLDRALPLGRGGLHEFSLVFACANPSQRANTLAKRLASAVLK